MGDVQDDDGWICACRSWPACRSPAAIASSGAGQCSTSRWRAGRDIERVWKPSRHIIDITGPLPFAWRDDCPPLTDNDAVEALCALADQAKVHFDSEFELPIVTIMIDTVVVTAAQHKEGGDNDASASQKVMKTMVDLSKHTNTLVVGIDHFGKVIETGTRGSSVKEGSADAILALLAIANSAAASKTPGWPCASSATASRASKCHSPSKKETRTDEDGDAITAQIIDWQATQQRWKKRRRGGPRGCKSCAVC